MHSLCQTSSIMSSRTCEELNVLNTETEVQGNYIFPGIFCKVYCSVYTLAVPGRAQYDWLGRISPLTPLFLTASGCSDLPIIHR